MSETKDDAFESWAILELMGHRRLAGLVSEQVIAGHAYLRLDVYDGDAAEPTVTQFYTGGAVYCITPTSEAIARAIGAKSQPRPVAPYELAAPNHDPDDQPDLYDGEV